MIRKEFIPILLIVLTSITVFNPAYGSLDQMVPEFLYLSIVQCLSSIFLIFQKKKNFKSLDITPLFFLGFLFTSILSFLVSPNLVTSYIEFIKHFLVFIAMINVISLMKLVKNLKQGVISMFVVLLSIEALDVFYNFTIYYSFDSPPARLKEFVAFTSNLNVASFSILFKIPFLIYAITLKKHRGLNILLYLIFSISVFDLFIMGSRGAILTLALFLILLLFFAIINKSRLSLNINKGIVFKILLISTFTLLIHKGLYQNANQSQVLNRVSSFDQVDKRSSFNFRLGYYKDGIDAIQSNPLLGVGIGIWKIVSIDYAKDRISEYQVPYHVHNDFIQIAAETGILGGLFFMLFFASLFYRLLKSFFTKKENRLLSFLLLCALLFYIIDSNLNFPRARPANLVNLILFTGFIVNLYPSKKLNYNFSFITIISTILILPIIVSFHFLLKSSIQQVDLFIDFNFTRYFERPLDDIEKIYDTYPNLTHTALSIKSAKGLYYFHQGDLEKAKSLFFNGMNDNPYIRMSEYYLSKIYLKEDKIDSAYYFASKSFYNLKSNSAHTTGFQTVLQKMDKLDELNEVFELVKDRNVEPIWQNHLLATISSKGFEKISEDDRNLLTESLEIFPNNPILLSLDKMTKYGGNKVSLANVLDEEAKKLFKNEEFSKAVDKWNKAKQLLPTEDAYYLNIAQTLLILDQPKLCLNELDQIISLNIEANDGKLEFLKGMSFVKLNKYSDACRELKNASLLGNIDARNVIVKLNYCN